MPLIINSLGGGHTHTHTNTHILMIRTGSIIRNQTNAWSKKLVKVVMEMEIKT